MATAEEKVGRHIVGLLKMLKDSVDSESDYEWHLSDDGTMDTVITICEKTSGRCKDIRTNPDFEDFNREIAEEIGVSEKKVEDILTSGKYDNILDDIRVYTAAEIALSDAWQFFEE